MKLQLTSTKVQPLHVLLIGNNPIDMSSIQAKLQQIRSRKIITEIAFDLKSIVERLVSFNPNYILIDDNIGKVELRETLNRLSSNRKTRDVPIALLKNSNYREALPTNSVMDYVLKQNLSTESLYNTLVNSLRLRKTQRYLYQAYKKRKTLFSKISIGD